MHYLYNWSAKRSGAFITIDHSTGKVTEIRSIEWKDHKLVATRNTGIKYTLSTTG